MGSITDFLEQELLDHVLNASYTSPANIYLALCTADPTDAATGASMNEVANANAYQRTAISFGVASSRSVTQDADVTFPQASGGGWGTVSHWAIVDNQTYGSGNVLAHGELASPKAINENNTPTVASGEIVISVDAGEMSDFLADELLDHVFNNLNYTHPDTYVALCTATVSDSDTGSTITEPSGGSYGRVQVNENGGASPTWDLATGVSPATVDNTHEVAFTTATGDWGTVVAVAIVDAASDGNILFYDNDMTDQPVDNGDTAKFSAGDIDITLS